MPKPLKILLGGVPFGQDNVGDEAIIEGVVGIVREVCPTAQLTVSTGDPATAKKLGVATIPLLGFDETQSPTVAERLIPQHDVFVWSGATGLADYPEVSARLMRIAQKAGLRTVLFGVGMNRDLNPSLYRVLPGRRKKVLSVITRATGNRIDAIRLEEWRRNQRAYRAIRRCLEPADLVVVRDPRSVVELRARGVTRPIVVGADAALRLTPTPWGDLALPADARLALESSDITVGLCISTQGQVLAKSGTIRSDSAGFIEFVDRLTERDGLNVVFIPMNPITDANLARNIRAHLKRPERMPIVDGRYEPADIASVASKLDVVISSRLHLLILSAISNIPLVGLANGTKVDAFLQDYGLEPACHVLEMDFDRLYEMTFKMVEEKDAFQVRAQAVRDAALQRIAGAQRMLGQVLNR